MKARNVACESLGINLPEAVAHDLDTLYNSLPLECKGGYHKKALLADSIQFEPGERAEVSVITTNSVDKSDEVVLPSGVNYDLYRRSGTVLWQHRQDLPPVASCTWIKTYHDSIRAKSTYPPRAEPDPDRPWYIDQVWDMVLSGILRAKSIGFLPTTPKREPTPAELESHPEWAGAGVWDSCTLVEYSLCAVGVNNESLVEAVNKKSLDPTRLLEMGISMPIPAEAAPEPAPRALSYIEKACQDPRVLEQVAVLISKGMAPDAAAVIAVATLQAKGCKPRKKARPGAALARVIDSIRIDPRAIVRIALESFRNRGRI